MEPEFASGSSQSAPAPNPTTGQPFASWQSAYTFPQTSGTQQPQYISYPPPQSFVFNVETTSGERTRRASAPGRYSTPLFVPTLESIQERNRNNDRAYSLPGLQTSLPAYNLVPTPVERAPFPHTQPRLKAQKAPKPDPYVEMNAILSLIQEKFKTLGHFLRILFADFRRRDGPDKRTKRHRSLVSSFLRGNTKIKAAEIVNLIYHHRSSRPTYLSNHREELEHMFDGWKDPSELRYARPAISCWAIQLVGPACRKQIGDLTVDEEVDGWEDVEPDLDDHVAGPLHARLAASKRRDARKKDSRPVVNWDIVESFRVKTVADTFERRARAVWFLTECMTATMKKGKVIVRKQRPHSTIQVAAISSFVLSRNRYANGYLSMQLGIWLWACRAHVDIKRVLSRMGLGLSDKTVRKALISMANFGQENLRKSMAECADRGELGWSVVMDNVQGYALVRQFGHGKESTLICGTAATAVRLYDCPPDAFKLKPYLESLVENKRATLTTDKLLDDLDLPKLEKVLALHWVRALLDFIPVLHHLKPLLSEIFRSAPIAVNRLPDNRVTEIQPLKSNAEREIELEGSKNCINDFSTQMGWKKEWATWLIAWFRGDGGTYATIKRLKKLLMAMAPGEYDSFVHVLATPEIWHMGSTMIGTLASNHYGAASSPDPSSLSRASSAGSQKRPTDLSKPDYYPTVAAMKLIWNAQILDCWRIHLCPDSSLDEHFDTLSSSGALPTLNDLIREAEVLQKRYGSLNAYERVLSKSDWERASPDLTIPEGSAWKQPTGSVPSRVNVPAASAGVSDDDENEDEDSASLNDQPVKKSDKVHVEEPGFDGDRPAANAALFKFEFGLWIEFSYAVSEGDTGRAWNVIKTWIFIFGGSTNTNYMLYLLDMYCLLTYDAPEPLRISIFMNWLANFAAKRGHHIPLDLMQEHHNHVLEDLVERTGKEFDNPAWREIASPNVHHVTRLKDEIEVGFDLKSRGNTHPEIDTRNETLSVIGLYREEELHYFRSRRSQGHRALPLLNGGYDRLDKGRMDEYIEDGTEYAAFVEMVLRTNLLADKASSNSTDTPPTPSPSPRRPSPSPPRSPIQQDAESSAGSGSEEYSEADSEKSISTQSDGDAEDRSTSKAFTGSGRRMFTVDENGDMHETRLDDNVQWLESCEYIADDEESDRDSEKDVEEEKRNESSDDSDVSGGEDDVVESE